jgi:hypothetical protein
MIRRIYAFPIWDITEADWVDHKPNRRFAIYSYGASSGLEDAVFDKETGLVWERSPSPNKQGWEGAIVYSYSKTVVGRKAWRLPTIEELLSLVDPSQANPSLPSGHPFMNVRTDYFYWSSTLGMTNPPTYAWGYNFGNGDTSNVLKTNPAYTWLVRGWYGHDYPV